MFIGMQHMNVGNYDLAKEFLTLAQDLNPSDAFLNQEIGTLHYHLEE